MEFINQISEKEISELLPQWSWLVPASVTPLFLTAFGDWIFGNSDGSISVLSVLEGTLEKVANSSEEFNQLNKLPDWCDEIFIASWYPIAIENGVVPYHGECIGWQIHPIIGGEFSVKNLKIFSMSVYQSLMSQLHAKIQGVASADP